MGFELKKSAVLCFCFLLLLIVLGCFCNFTRISAYAESNGSWITEAPIPIARYNLGLAAVNNRIYAIGGFTEDSNSNSTDEYDPSTNTWTSKASMPVSAGEFAVAVANDKIYVFGLPWGAKSPGSDNRVFQYDPSLDVWTEKSQIPVPFPNCEAAATVNNKIYVFDQGYSVWEYDPLNDSYTSKSPIPNPLGYADVGSIVYQNAVAINDTIYLIGGDALNRLNQVYNTTTDTWTLKDSMPTSSWFFGTAALNGKIYVFGGDYANVYDPATDTWSNATSMPTPRGSFGMVALGDNIYVVGGVDSVVYTENEQFTIPEFSSFLIQPLLLIATLPALIVTKKKLLARADYRIRESAVDLMYSLFKMADFSTKKENYQIVVEITLSPAEILGRLHKVKKLYDDMWESAREHGGLKMNGKFYPASSPRIPEEFPPIFADIFNSQASKDKS